MKRFLITLLSLALLPLLAACTQEDGDREPGRPAVAVALDTVEITLIDHLVFSDDDYVSMAQSGYFKPGESMCVL